MRIKSKIVHTILCVSVLSVVFSCTKKSALKYEGNYEFLVITETFSSSGFSKDTINFSGSIEAQKRKTLMIKFGFQNVIYPKIDTDGNLSYTEWEKEDSHNHFNGKFDAGGNLDIAYGQRFLGGGWSRRINGSKTE